MQGVFPWNLSRKKDVFATNERIVYTGEWKYGSFVFVPVAAFNVGDISIGQDFELKTNLLEFENSQKIWDDKKVEFFFKKGEEVGMFNAGSTIILVFEAPRYLRWNVQVNDKVFMGNSLANIQ
jgi:phosphatidylserine decarboxylase